MMPLYNGSPNMANQGATSSSTSSYNTSNNSNSQNNMNSNLLNQNSKLENVRRSNNINKNNIINLAIKSKQSNQSSFEKFISGKVSTSVSTTGLKQFGYNLFKTSRFAPLKNIPVGPNYIIGPNDQIKITVWGSINGNYTLTVDRNGNIDIPGVGTVTVAGLKFKDLKDVIESAFSKYYKNFHLNVTMGALRTMTVYLTGYAKHPGSCRIYSTSTLIDALFSCGGPSKVGSMRNIEVKRDGEILTHFDVYRFLIYGDTEGDIRLQPGDIIYIPPIGPEVAIAGAVKYPAIYELKGKTTVLDLIHMAGGLEPFAYKGRVQVYRVINHQYRTAFEDSLSDLRKHPERDFVLKNGDLVKIYPVPQAYSFVQLEGAVAMPGRYAIKPGVTTIKSIVEKAGGLLYYASDKAEITRMIITKEGPKYKIFHINISKALKGNPKDNITLEPQDYIFVKTIPDFQGYGYVYIGGQVRYPGVYPIYPGERLSSVLERAGGYTKNAYLRGAIFTRKSVQAVQQKSINMMINKLEQELLASNARSISSAVSSGETSINSAYIQSEQAFMSSLKSIKASGRVAIYLEPIRLLKGSSQDIILKNGDSLYIPTRNDVVNVVGAVMSPGAYVYNPHYTWRDYIRMAGGYEADADKSDVYIYKANGMAVKPHQGFIDWNPFMKSWEFTAFRKDQNKIWPGDTIVVPQKLQEFPWLRNIKDITQILMNIAVTAGIAIHLY
ncbi:MAG: polysaccharide export protein [Hydrogenobaculum sp.]|nr:MAG: polysaccharide export protein [Hydrogenobaculum sp.]